MKLFYREYGQGKPLIILHGLLGSLDNWHSLSRKFGEHYRVFTLDQRNHGGSPHSAEMNYEVMTADLGQFLDDHQLKAAAIIGHSMGGKSAMTFALRYSTRVDVLVVVDIAPKSYPPHHDHIFEALISLDLKDHDSRTTVDQALARSIESPAVRQFLMKNLKRDDQNAFRWKMNLEALRSHYDEINSELVSEGTFTGPALFVGGKKSDYLSGSDLPSIRKLFPEAQLRELDTGHWVHAESPDDFFSVVMDFLRQSGYF